MTQTDLVTSPRLERLLARLLHGGTWLACIVIAAGWLGLLVLPAASGPLRVVTAGIGLFILLPVLRVTLMLGAFVRMRDYRLGIIAALVLATIIVGFVLGTQVANPGG